MKFSNIITKFINFCRPLLGPEDVPCGFWPTCSKFAEKKLLEEKLYKAIPIILTRLIFCSPFKILLFKASENKKFGSYFFKLIKTIS